MKKLNRALSFLLVLVMVLTMIPATALAVVDQQQPVSSDPTYVTSPLGDRNYNKVIAENYPQKAENSGLIGSLAAAAGSVSGQQIADLGLDLTLNREELKDLAVSLYTPEEQVRVIVILEGESLLEQGYTTEQISANLLPISNKVSSMEQAQQRVLKQIQQIVNALNTANLGSGLGSMMPPPELKYSYNVAINGMSVDVPYAALAPIRELDDVQTAFIAPKYDLPEDMSDGTADPNMQSTTTSFGSAQAWNTLGYTGEGMRIAIIDTGLDTDHPSFASDNFTTTDTSLTVDEIAGVLENLNAYELFSGLTAEKLYISDKIPFGFNYVDEKLDVTHDNDNMGDHGTHVAGIAAANKLDTTDVVGVAPDAQLIAMKVFGYNGGAYFDDILAALEDCFYLNVDAVNLSLGTPAGYTTSGDQEIDAIFQRITKSDMIASISAGNSASAAYGNGQGTNVNYASDPDNGIVSSPATYGGTVVASVENTHFMSNYLTADGRNIVYIDYYAYPGSYDHSMLVFVGEQPFVVVPGLGTEDDFAQVDVTGKIALVQRGTTMFTEKLANAYNAGAIGCLIYDNVEGSLISFAPLNSVEEYADVTFPAAFISMADGLHLVEVAGSDGEGTLTIMPVDDMIAADSPLAGQMSDFSSWGVTPDLQLVPDVTAPGGNIYSCYTDGTYGTMSGTSMSAPHIAGMAALVLQYLRDNYDLSEEMAHTIAEALIMSTATPVVEPSGILYSPRKQGSGSANVYDALISAGYLTVNGGKPKVSLGDDEAKNGVYSFQFEINNLSNEDMTYILDSTVLTDWVQEIDGVLYMGESSYQLSSDVDFGTLASELDWDANQDGVTDMRDVKYLLDVCTGLEAGYDALMPKYDLRTDSVLDTADAQALYEILLATNAGGKVTVAAGETVTVTVAVTLSDDDKAYMDEYYENGIYVDGFVRCYAADGSSDLSLPFMGFYGDWSDAKVFDTGWYYDEEAVPERYINVLWTTFGQRAGYILGENPYLANEAYDPAHNVISPNGDGYQDALDDIYLGMLRGARDLSIKWSSEGETLAEGIASYVRKSYYMDAYGICYPFVYSDYFDAWYTFTDENGEPLPDGTVVDLTLSAWLDDGDDEVDEVIDNISMIVDNTAPVLHLDTLELIYDAETDSRIITFQVSDNYDIAAVMPLTNTGAPIEYIAVDDKAGEKTTITVDVSGYDSTFWIVVGDYGCNESYYEITFEGEFNVDFDKFYAYRRYAVVTAWSDYYNQYVNYETTAYNGWHSFDDPSEMLMHTDEYYSGETSVAAAEYIDGYIFGVDVNSEIFVMKAGDWTRIPLGAMPEAYDASWNMVPYPVLDMAYDYANDVLYILTDELDYGAGGHLMTLDYMTGYVEDLGIVTTVEGSQPLTLACDNSGVLYTIDYVSGDLYTIDPANVVETEPENSWEDPIITIPAARVGATGYVPMYVQSMTVDHETDTLYWLAFCGVAQGPSVLYSVNKTTGELTAVGNVEYNSEMTALFKPYDSGKDIIPDAELEYVTLNKDAIIMGIGAAEQLTAYPNPFNADLGELTWTSSDESVALVADGLVKATGEGRAIVTVSTADGLTAECMVDVINLKSDLTMFDMANYYMWQSVNAGNTGTVTYYEDSVYTETGFTAAAYFNGSVYASEYGGAFYKLDPATMNGKQIGSSGSTLYSMAFNYADGFMYAIEQVQASMWESYTYLSQVNLNTGALNRVVQIPSDYTVLGSLAIDYAGNFYAICSDNWTYDVALLKWTVADGELKVLGSWSLGDAAMNIYNSVSMTYSAKDNGLFYSDNAGVLYWIDMDSLIEDNSMARAVQAGIIGEPSGYAMNMGLFTVPATEPVLPQVAITGVTVPASYMLMEGGSVSAGVTVNPWNAYPTITYTMADTTVATVTEGGTITGVSAGTTNLTVTVSGWDTTYEIPVTVVEPTGTLHGFLLTDFGYTGDFFFSFEDTDPTYGIYDISDFTAFSVYSGAYFDGVIYAYGQDATGEYDYKNYFLTITPDYDSYSFEIVKGTKIHYTLRDMAMDYTTGNLYAIAEGAEYAGAVAQVNRETGEVTIIADTGIPFAAMTIDAAGQMYGIGEDDNLYAVNKTTGALNKIGHTGVNAGRTFQSMHYDLNSGNVYWAQVADDQTSSLRLVDLSTGSTTGLGLISPSGAMVGALHTVPTDEPTEPKEDTFKVTGIKLPEVSTVVKGGTLQLNATVLTSVELKSANVMGSMLPNASAANDVVITWTSSDDSIATVDTNGLVTGVSAGEVTITASTAGHSDTCKVVVTEGERLLYAYDETNAQWISFTASDPGTVTTVRADAEGEAKLLAATYAGNVIYAYDVDGKFWSIDPTTFQRTALGNGINGLTYEVEITSPWYGTYYMECPLSIIDLSWDNGKLYAAVGAMDPEDPDYVLSTLLCTMNIENGTIGAVVYSSGEILPGNLLVDNGIAYFVDAYMSGMLTYVDLTADEISYSQAALVQGYWGDAAVSVGLFKDQLTGTVYALRDYTDTTDGEWVEDENGDWNWVTAWDGLSGEATLCTLNLADADIVELGLVGTGLQLMGLFIK